MSLLFILAISIPFLGCNSSHFENKIHSGFLDLSNLDSMESNQSIPLGGEWKFIPDQFIDPVSIEKNLGEALNISTYRSWNNQILGTNSERKGFRFGTYYLKILIPESNSSNYSLKIPYISSAYRIYINNRMIEVIGLPADAPTKEIPKYKPTVVDFEIKNQNFIEIVLHVSNFQHNSGGLSSLIYFGKKENIHSYSSLLFFRDAFLIGSLFILFLYQLAIFSFQLSYYPALFFGLFSLSFSFRFLLTGEMLVRILLPHLSFDAQIRMEYINTSISAILGLLFFHSNFFHSFSKRITGGLIIALSVMIAFIVHSEIYYFTKYLNILLFLLLLSIIYVIINLTKIAIVEKGDSIIILFTISVWGLAMINDMLVYLQIIKSYKVSFIGIIIFMMVQAYLISKFFNQAFVTSRDLSEKLLKTYESYSRFVPEEFLAFLGKRDVTQVMVGDVIKTEATILFCDIRSFTSITEKTDPSALFTFLNEYFETLNKIIIKYDGIIDKYIGDAILAIFPNKCEDALNCAIEMQIVLQKNYFSLGNKQVKIEAGLALHQGEVLLGVIGGKKLLQTTVISDTVNTCSRLQSLTKVYGTRIIISETVLQNIDDPGNYHIRFLDHASVQGKEDSIYICEVYDCDDEKQIELKQETKTYFDRGVMIYQSGDYENSWKVFIEILKLNPTDGPSIFYLNRSATFMVKGITLIHEYEEKIVNWNESWETGIKLIDDQHKILFDIINDLNKAIKFKREKEVINHIIDNLNIYVYTHFTMEEELMLRYSYPDFENHKKSHKSFIDKIENMITRYKNSTDLDTEDFLNFLINWLTDHIIESDRDGYAPFIKTDRQARLTE